MTTFDSAVYDKTRLIRVSNSKHRKSGLYKIPISQYDFNNKTVEEISEMAKEQVEREDELTPCSLEYVSIFLKGLVSNGVANEKKNPLKTSSGDITDGILNGFREGNRNVGLTSVAGTLHSRGITGDMLYAYVSGINQKGDPVSEDVLKTIVDSVERYPVKDQFRQPDEGDFVTMKQASEKWMYGKQHRNNLETGFDNINKICYTFDVGKVLMFAARSSVGKTNLALQVADQLAQSLGGKNLFCTLEMESAAVFYRAAKIDSSKANGDTDNEQLTEILYNDEALRDRVVARWDNTVMVDKDHLSISQIENYFIKAQALYNDQIKVLFIDYVGLLADTDDQKSLSKVAKEFKNLAKRLKTRIVLVAQLSRKGEDGTVEPTINMLRDSGSLEDAGDIILGMWYDKDNQYRIHVKVLKNREGIRNAKFDLIQDGVAYEEAEFCVSAHPNRGSSGRSWNSQE